MRFSGRVHVYVRVAAVLCLVAVGLVLTCPLRGAEETPGRPQPLTAEQQKRVWTVEARAAAAALKIGREDGGKVVEAYVTARKNYADKTAELPRTREGWQQRQELAEKARSGLKEGLVKAVGADKAEKIMGTLSPFGMTAFLLDRMVNDLLALELPREKVRKALLAVIEYNRDAGKAFTEAREAGNFEGLREKMGTLIEGLNKELAEILTEKQMAEWKEKHGELFRRLRRSE
jgi:hypothetical protein